MKALWKMFVLMMALILSVFSYAQDVHDIHNEDYKYLGSIYQQSNYQLNDPFGDILLLWTNSQIPKIIIKSLKGKQAEIIQQRKEKIAELIKQYPQFAPNEETNNLIIENYVDVRVEDFPHELEGHKAPFKTKNLTLMIKQVISEEYNRSGIEPKLGVIHQWSPEISKKLKKKFPIFSRFSKLLMALCRGGTSNYMVTGYEDELAEYILSRSENSISIEEMFRVSYRINQGDVYLTLLTIENLLSRHWLTTQRSKRSITTKLQDITNFNYKTDKFGSWYHLFGIMLYGFAEGGFKSSLVGTVESWGSLMMGGFQDERQENIINKRGGKVGHRLRDFIKKQEYKSFELNSKYTEVSFYLQLDEDFSRRLRRLK